MKVPEVPDSTVYETVANRHSAYDSILWQAPVLSLTAQAFLLTIALGHDSKLTARILAGTLSFVSSVASIQLMMKHRYMQVRDAKWLEEYEKRHLGDLNLHGKPTYPTSGRLIQRLGKFKDKCLDWLKPLKDSVIRVSAYRVWVFALAAFGIVAACTIIIACFRPEWLHG